MPTLLVSTTDFTGQYAIATDVKTAAKLQSYIDTYEEEYILKLLGKELGDLFIASVSGGVPVGARYLTIFNELTYEDSCGVLRISKGMLTYLVAAIFYHYVADGMTESTQAGIGTANVDTALRGSLATQLRHAESRFNEALKTAWAIQEYCNTEEPATYPEYNGQTLEVAYSSFF